MIFNVGAGGASNAGNIKYDNSLSGLEADNVQGAVDELNDSLKTVKTYVGEDGKLHFVDSEGADSVLPFSGFKRHYSSSITVNTTSTFIELGFKPKFISIDSQWFYDEELNKCWYSNGVSSGVALGVWTSSNLMKFDSIEENGFYVTGKAKTTRHLFAFG